MSTPHEEHDLLPAFAAGTLDDEARARFEAHLASCLVCRRELDFMRQVASGAAEHGADLFADHPEVDDIVAAATGEDVGTVDDGVRRHLALCAACAAEVAWVRGERSPFARTDAPPAERPTAARARSAWLGWATAAAAIVVLGLVLSLRPGAATLESVSGSTVLVDLPSNVRAAEQTTFVVPANARAVTLTFPVDLPPAAFPATVELVDDATTVLLRDTVARQADLLDGQFHAIVCGAGVCPPGSYAVRIAAGTDQEATIRFTLVAAE